MKHIFLPITFVALVVLGFVYLAHVPVANTDPAAGFGSTARTVTYATSSVASTTAGQVLAGNSRANFRRVQQNSTGTLWCFASATSSATIQNNGIRLTQGQSYVWASYQGNLWPGAISCIADSTSTVLTEQTFE